MIRSSFYILLVISVIKAAPNSYLDGIPGLGEWIHSSSNSKNEPVEVESDKVPTEEPQEVLDASNSNKDIKDMVNQDEHESIPVDNLLDQLSDEVKLSDDQHKSELVAISQQLGTALYDNSIGKVLVKGIWHAVDLGLAGSSQRKRSAIKANEIAKGFFNGFRRFGEWLCGLLVAKQIPESFDARDTWPNCKELISSIRDQGRIGSCWAVAAASMLSDRLCIASEGIHKILLSSEDLMRCCKKCAKLEDGVVAGGNIDDMLHFMKRHGIVSGGDYGSGKGCMPYSYLPRSDPDFIARGKHENFECDGKCSNTNYEKLYEKDKYFIDSYNYYQLPRDTAALKENLMTKGSCIAMMIQYDDFYWHYKKGTIYTRTAGSEYVNDHVVRVIGWGKENEIDYWLVANSRGESWGEGGTGKINAVSGCSFGQHAYCVKPKVPKLNT